jgi:hypothetical protein
MIRLLAVLVYVFGIVGIQNSFAQSLFDSFDGSSISAANWNTFYPSFNNSSIAVSNGSVTFQNGSFLTTKEQFIKPTIVGKFSITGWEYDRFKVIFRSDGTTIDSHWQVPRSGVGVAFTASSNPDWGSGQTVQIWDFSTDTKLTAVGPTLNRNTFYDFKIVDDGNLISVFLDNLSTPILSYSTAVSLGNFVQIGNREQAAGSWPPPYYLQMDYISIIPEPSSLSLLLAGGAALMVKRRRKK